MTSPLLARIAQLEALEKAATPGPWTQSDFSGYVLCKGEREVQTNHNHGNRSWTDVVAIPQHGHAPPGSDQHANMALIAESRNAFPKLLKALRILVEGMEFMKGGCLVPPDGGSPSVQDYTETAEQALAKADALLRGNND